MQISSRFTIAIHMMTCMETFKEDHKVTSDFLAASINVNPVIIRRILSQLKDAGLIEVREEPEGQRSENRWMRSHFWTYTGQWSV